MSHFDMFGNKGTSDIPDNVERKQKNIQHILDNYNLYTLMKLEPNCSYEDIRKRYLKLCKTIHPDKGGDKKTFFAISLSYKILSDPEKRTDYNCRYLGKFVSKSDYRDYDIYKKEYENKKDEFKENTKKIRSSVGVKINAEEEAKRREQMRAFNRKFQEMKDPTRDYVYDIKECEDDIKPRELGDFTKSNAEINRYLEKTANIFRGSYFDAGVFQDIFEDVHEEDVPDSLEIVPYHDRQRQQIMQNMEFDENGNRKIDQHQAFMNSAGDIQERLAQVNLNEYREKPTRHVFKDSAFDSRETGARMNELLFDRNRPVHITDEDPMDVMMRNYRENFGGNQRW